MEFLKCNFTKWNFLRSSRHPTPTYQAVARTPSDSTRTLLKRLFFCEKSRPTKSFCDKMKPCTPANKIEFYAKNRFFPTFSPVFLIVTPKFFNRFSFFRLHCVQDIPTSNSYFKKGQISCVLTILRRKTSKNDKFYIACELHLWFSRSRSENVPEGPRNNA